MKRKLIVTLLLTLTLTLCISSQTFERTKFGVKMTINIVDVEIQFYSNDVVRILKSPKGSKFEKNSFTVIKMPDKVKFNAYQKDNQTIVGSENITIEINQLTGQLTFADAKGKVILSEKANGTEFEACKYPSENAYSVKQQFELTPNEAIYGLGQHQTGKMNLRNETLKLEQKNMFTAIPYFYSTNGYGLFWDNTSTTIFEDNKMATSFKSEIGNCIDYYFMRSDNADQGLSLWRSLSGKAPLFPRWTYGYWQSRERYISQTELIGTVKKYRDLKVPLDGIVQDWQYWGVDNKLWNSTEFGNPSFPNPKQMIDSIHQLNAHVIISVWPSFGTNTKIYNEFKQQNMLYDFITWPQEDVKVYDAFNPKARDIYWKHIKQNLFDIGMDGWWLDATEPEQMNPIESSVKTFAGSFLKVRNAYPIVSSGGVYNHQRQLTSDKRVFILTRSAFAGQQRYGTVTWSGDIDSSWDVFKKQISNGLNMSVSGIPYWNTDIGGFFSGRKYEKGVSDPAYQELYVRWFQFGTFCPMMRSHGTNTPREIYQFGKKGDWAYDALEKFIHLRYRIMPYIYSTAWEVTDKASTFMRPLAMDFANDKNVLDINNEYMFGRSFLVCPVTDSLYTNRVANETKTHFNQTKSAKVYLPSGSIWYDFWTGKKFDGGKVIEREVPMDIMPLYVKAGAIVPFGPSVQYSGEKDDSELEIRVYAGANGEFTLYEDENDNYNYEKGKYATITFKWNDATQTLSIDNRKGKFIGMLQTRTFNIVKVSKGNGHDIQNTNKPTHTVKYNGKKLVIKL